MGQFEDQTFDAILNRLLDDVDDSFDKRQGSHVYNMLAPAAAELAQAYIALDQVLTFGFASEDQPRDKLELRAQELGVPLIDPVKAEGELTFTASASVTIPTGTRVRTDDDEPIFAVTTESGSVDDGETITLSAEAEEPGTDGNVSAGSFEVVVGDLAGVLEVENAAAFEGGANRETDEALLNRYFNRARQPATSGNKAQYRQWATDVAGVSKARVQSLWDGPGTVKVLLISDDFRAPDATIVSNVQEYIDPNQNGDGSGAAPVGAAATIEAVTEVSIDVTAEVTVTADSSLAQVTADFEEGLTEYLADLVDQDDSLVRYTQIIQVLLGIPRVVDFKDLKVNGGESNIELDAADEVPVTGTVTFNEPE